MLLLLVLVLAIARTSAEYEGRVVCYYKSDNVYRAEGYRMQPQEIDPEICTHIIYYSAYLHPHDAIVPSDPLFDLSEGGYKKIVKLKEVNPKLKVMLSLRNDPDERDLWPLISAQKNTRSWFSTVVVEFLRAHNFDGLDIDWQIHSSKKNSNDYLLLLKELRHYMDFDSSIYKYKVPRLQLSILLPAQIQQLHRHFLLANVSLQVDFINVATMDYWSLDPYTVQHHAPLFKNETEGSFSPLNVDESIKYYLFKCVPPEKIVLGVPTYGRSFMLASHKHFRLGSRCKYPGEKGFATNSPGTLAYFEICTYIKEEYWSIGNAKATSMGPYAYHRDRWVGYDDVRIISIKAKYARDKGLGGLMFWTIDQDDFRGYCQQKYPLVRAGKFTFNTGIVVPDGETLQKEEERWKMENEPGYIYPKPTIQQPEYTVHEVTSSTETMSSVTPSTTVTLRTQPTTVDSVLLLMHKPTGTAINQTTETPSTSKYPLTSSTTAKPVMAETTVDHTTAKSSSEATSPTNVEPSTTTKPLISSVTAKPVMVTENLDPRITSEATSTPNVEERNNVRPPPAQPPPMNLFTPNISPQVNGDTDSSPNDAILHLNRVLGTVNQIIANANAINGASNNGANMLGNVTIDPAVLQILQTLSNFRNSDQFTINNSGPGKPTNTTVRVESDINTYRPTNDLLEPPNKQMFVPASNNLNPTQKRPNITIPASMLADRSFFFSGRDIVNIHLNVTVNNNYYTNN